MACSGVTLDKSEGSVSQNGPPEAVKMMRFK